MAKLKRLTPEELVLKTIVAPTGANGLPGPRGPQGDKGEKGNDGIDGLRGGDGSPGLPGDKGERGDRGEKGEEGLPGVSGSPGTRGVQGETGPIPKHKWRGTVLSFEEPDGEFGKAVDLRGRDGTSGGGAGGGSIIANITKLRDVQAPEPTDEQVLTFNTATGKWIAADATGGVTDHGALTGLADDDHPQYQAFGTVQVATQSDVVADVPGDTLTLVGGQNITITTDATGDEVTFDGIASGQLSVFTVATLPTGVLGRLIFVTDGDSGVATIAVFDGSTWRRILIGNTVTSV